MKKLFRTSFRRYGLLAMTMTLLISIICGFAVEIFTDYSMIYGFIIGYIISLIIYESLSYFMIDKLLESYQEAEFKIAERQAIDINQFKMKILIPKHEREYHVQKIITKMRLKNEAINEELFGGD